MKIRTIAAGITAAVMMGAMSITAFAAETTEPLIQAAAAIDESLESIWGQNRDVSYTLDNNSIDIALWDDGINEENFGAVNNWDKVREDKLNLYNAYATVFDQVGIKDGDLTMYYLDDSQSYSLLTIHDGKVIYDYSDYYAANDKEANGNFVKCSEATQKARIAEHTGCKAEDLFFVKNGRVDETDPVVLYDCKDSKGNEADLRLMLFEDGSVMGYTPDNIVIDATNCFAK